MTRPSRLAFAAVLLATVASAARAVEPDKLLPAKADMVAVVNIKRIFGADVVKNVATEEIKQEAYRHEARVLTLAFGIDPITDVERVVLAYVDTNYGDRLEPEFIAILHGAFDAEKMFKAADAAVRGDPNKFAMLKEGSAVLMRYTRDPKKPPAYATVIDAKRVVVASDKKLIADAVKASDANKPPPIKKELADLVRKIDDKTDITAVFLLKGKFEANSLANSPLRVAGIPIGGDKSALKYEKLDKALPNAEHAVFTVKFGADAEFGMTVGMKDEGSANDMHNAVTDLFEQLKPIAGLAALLDPQAKPVPALLAAVKVTSKGKDVTMALKMTGNDIRTLLTPPKPKDKKDAKDKKN